MRLTLAFLALCACTPLSATDCLLVDAAADAAGLFAPAPLVALGAAVACP